MKNAFDFSPSLRLHRIHFGSVRASATLWPTANHARRCQVKPSIPPQFAQRATFHAAVSVHDPVNGYSPTVITQRIREALSIWARDAELTVVNTSVAAGNYIGNGDPDDPAGCLPPSGDTSATGQQGTLCRFFKYVAGGLKEANKFGSLSPAYKTKFVPIRDEEGQWKSSVYFECHYFDVSLTPATGQPFWTAESHVDLDGEARKIDGRWLLTRVNSSAVPVPVPPNPMPQY